MIQLSDHFTYKRLAKFVLSPILMMIFCSVYSVVDGVFVSNFVGQDAFTAVNLVFPFIMVLSAFGFMFGSGGTAIVSKTMGENNRILARKYFTLIVIVAALVGVLLAVLGIVFLQPICIWMGASGDVLPLTITYGTILLCALPFFMLQNMFQNFFITAEKPKLGFVFTVISGCINMVGDALFVAVFRWGIWGAALATAAGQCFGGVAPLVYFSCKNSSKLRFGKPRWFGSVVVKTCTNGSSELVGNIAMSLVSMLYNKQLIRIAGDSGVDAFGVMMYIQFVFIAVFIGYCIGVMPIVGFNYGAQNRVELQNVFKKSAIIIALCSFVMTAAGIGLAWPLAKLFFSYSDELCQMTTRGMMLYSLCFLFAGFNMFASGFFTALNNGLVSAILSFWRTLVLQVVCVYILPLWLGLDGVWISTVVAEALSFVTAVIFLAVNNKKYGYIKRRGKTATDCR